MVKYKKSVYIPAIYILCACFYLWLAAHVPYVHDDWDWGLSNGIAQLLTASINSRYVGNFFAVIMTRSEFVKTILMGLIFVSIPLVIAGIAAMGIKESKEEYRLIFFLLANFLLLSMDLETWRETFGWVSGYANYVISALLMLFHVYVLMRLFNDSAVWKDHTVTKDIVLGCTSFLGQLFLENLSIYMFGLVLVVGFLCYKKYQKIPRCVMYMSVGIAIGLVIMFSSNIYSMLWSTGEALDGVRQLSIRPENSLTDNIKGIILQIAGLVRRGGEEQYVINIVLLGVLAYSLARNNVLHNKVKVPLIVVNLGIICYFSVVKFFNISYAESGMIVSALGASANFLLYGATSLELLVIYWPRKQDRVKIWILWFSVIAYLAPMIITYGYGPRIYFISNIFSILVICLLSYHSNLFAAIKMKNAVKIVLVMATLVWCGYYGIVYSAIDECNQQRLEIITYAEENGAKEILLPRYPYEEFLWNPNPVNEQRVGYYKEFYGIPENVNVRFE